MPPPDVELRPIAAVPTPDIVDLLRVCMGDSERRTEAFWRWKHEDNPFGPSPGVAAYVGDSLAGIRVVLCWEWLSGDARLRAVRAVDTATHPSWQRMGLFRKMTLAVLESTARDGADFVFNTPNAKSEAGYLSMGWQALGRVPVLAKPAAPWRWPARQSGAPDQSGGGEVRAESSSVTALLEDRNLPAFLERSKPDDVRMHTPRTLPFLRWRYAQPPKLEYDACWRIDAAGSGAVVIFRATERRGFREILLAEVLVSPDAGGAAAAASLLRRLPVESGYHYAVAHAAARTPERRALLRAGFFPVPRGGPRLTVRELRPLSSIPDPAAMASWRFGLGDLEVF